MNRIAVAGWVGIGQYALKPTCLRHAVLAYFHMIFSKPNIRLLFCLFSMTGCSVVDDPLEELAPRHESHQLVSRDTRVFEDGTADVLVYKIPVGGTLCSDNGEGNCKYWDGFDAQFDVQLHRSAPNIRIAEERAVKAIQRHCRRVWPRATPVITDSTVDFVRFQSGCHPR